VLQHHARANNLEPHPERRSLEAATASLAESSFPVGALLTWGEHVKTAIVAGGGIAGPVVA
jgi:hypothetical protein